MSYWFVVHTCNPAVDEGRFAGQLGLCSEKEEKERERRNIIYVELDVVAYTCNLSETGL